MPEEQVTNTYDKDYSAGEQFEVKPDDRNQPVFNTDAERAAEEKRLSILKNRNRRESQGGEPQQLPDQATRSTVEGGAQQPKFATRPTAQSFNTGGQESSPPQPQQSKPADTPQVKPAEPGTSNFGAGAATARNLSAARDVTEDARRRLIERSGKQQESTKSSQESARRFGAEAGDPVLASVPSLTKQCMFVVRRWQQIPDNVSDQDALAQGLITPEMLQMVMQVVQQLMQGCLSNSRAAAWTRVRGYIGSKEFDRLGDNLRLNGVINNWFDRLGVPRDIGDVVTVRRALVEATEALKQEDFNQLQTEILFLTI